MRVVVSVAVVVGVKLFLRLVPPPLFTVVIVLRI